MLITRIWRDQPGKFFCISTKSARGKWEDHFFRKSEFGEIDDFIKDNSDKDIYFCPHGFTRDRRVKEYAALPHLLWSDMDDAVDPEKMKIRPTILIESSPGRFVGLWMIEREVSEELNRRIAYLIGDNQGGWDITQVLRVPGTINYKYEARPRVKIRWSDGPAYTRAELERQLPASKNSGGDIADVFKRWEKKLPHWCRRELIDGKPTQGKRSEMIWKLGNTLIERGVPLEDAFALLKASPWNKFRGRRNEDDQLKRELDKAVEQHFSSGAPVPVAAEGGYDWLSCTLDEVEEGDIDWIWYPYLARGELTILEGDPGLGKSYLAEMVSGALTDGISLPSVKKLPPIQGKVAYFDIENSAGSVTKKRLRENGFRHLENFIQEERLFSIDDEDALDEIYDAFERVRPTLVVFDTINTYLGKADAFKGHEAQQAFVKFREIAKRFHCAVLVIRHLTKSSKERALYRGQGSIAFAGVARVVITVGSVPDDPETAAFAVTKVNIAKKPPAHTFNIIGLPDTLKERDRSEFNWGEFIELTADDIVSMPVEKKGNERIAAQEFLKETLDGHALEFKRIERMAEARSISLRTLQRAADELQIKRKARGFGKDKVMWWELSS